MVSRRSLPPNPSLEQLRKQAKDLKHAFADGDPQAIERVKQRSTDSAARWALGEAQLVIAREYGFASWPLLKRHVERLRTSFEQKVHEFVEAAIPPKDDHRAGTLDRANRLLRVEPSISSADIVPACMLGELQTVRAMLARDAAIATRRGGPRDWDPLLYLCFSRYLRLDADRAPRMVEIARLLLDHGADPNTHWVEPSTPQARESALYGAAGVANNVELARLLLERGADPNDGETPYHAVEFDGVPCAELIFEHGLDEIGQTTALLHKFDYPDLAGCRKLLELGVNPDGTEPYGKTALHQAVFRGHDRRFFDLLFEFGADPNVVDRGGKTPYARAARAGHTVAMQALLDHGADDRLVDPDRFIAACARADTATVQSILERQPEIVGALPLEDRQALVEAAAAGNTAGVRTMLDAGFDVDTKGPVWSEAAIHRAAMAGHLECVRLLVERGADLTLRDRSYRSSPLGWAEHGGHEKILKLLLGDPSKLDLQDAIAFGFTDRAIELLGDRDVDAPFAGGERGVLLRTAAYYGRLELVRHLLDRGADPTLVNGQGRTAVDYAVERGHGSVADLLRDRMPEAR